MGHFTCLLLSCRISSAPTTWSRTTIWASSIHSSCSSLPVPFCFFWRWSGRMSFQGLQSTLTLSSQDFSPPSLKLRPLIGDFDLSISRGKPSKLVQSHCNWTIAWNATFAAILWGHPWNGNYGRFHGGDYNRNYGRLYGWPRTVLLYE